MRPDPTLSTSSPRFWLLLCLGVLALCASVGCGDGADDDDAVSDDDDTTPPENFIPITGDVCAPEDVDGWNAAAAVSQQLIDVSDVFHVSRMSLCDASSCGGGCTDAENPMLQVLREADTWLSPEHADGLAAQGALLSSAGDSALEKYINQALILPFRTLLLAIPDGSAGGTDVPMTFLNLGHSGCDPAAASCTGSFLVPDSLEPECAEFNTVLPVDVSSTYSITSASNADAAFGFTVPISEDLSSLLGSTSMNDFLAWVDGGNNDTLEVRISGLSLTLEGSPMAAGDDPWASGAICGRITGEVDLIEAFGDPKTGIANGVAGQAVLRSYGANADGKVQVSVSLF